MDYGDKGAAGGCVPVWGWYVFTYMQNKYNFSFMGKPLTYWMPFLKFCNEWRAGNIVQNVFPMMIGFTLTVYTALSLAMVGSLLLAKHRSRPVKIPSNFF